MSRPDDRTTLAKNADAIVVGGCAHGLAIARSLWRAGLAVTVLEADPALPGIRTRAARVLRVAGIHGEQLLEALRRTAGERQPAGPLPLFLTNDRMIETVAAYAAQVAADYRVSWLPSAAAIAPLLTKSGVEARCRSARLDYPRTIRLHAADDPGAAALDSLRYPLIVKPDRPLSAFKTMLVASRDRLATVLTRARGSYPVVVQEFIPGDDTTIRFGAVYFRNGTPLARFEGRKLRSRPLGHTTIAVSEPDDGIHALTLRFFDGLSLSGPASLELKQGPDGRHWVIEPTVGRTDFWVGVCIDNGVDLPLIEYAALTGAPLPDAAQSDRVVWINGERDPAAIVWLLARHPSELAGRWPRGVYCSLSDPLPYLAAAAARWSRLPGRAWRRLTRDRRGRAASA